MRDGSRDGDAMRRCEVWVGQKRCGAPACWLRPFNDGTQALDGATDVAMCDWHGRRTYQLLRDEE